MVGMIGYGRKKKRKKSIIVEKHMYKKSLLRRLNSAVRNPFYLISSGYQSFHP